jgi:Ca2+-binding RTX toxin-like protein
VLRTRILTVLGFGLVLSLVSPAAASAGVRCAVEGRGADGPAGDALTIATTQFADAVAIHRDGNRIEVSDDRRIKPASCGRPRPTISTIDLVELATEQQETFLYLDLAGGLLRPGATMEEQPWSEIELEIDWPFGFLGIGGRRRQDVMRFGEQGESTVADLNGDGDEDVTLNELGNLLVRGQRGDDVLDAGGIVEVPFPGGREFAPLATFSNLEAGHGDDAVYGGARKDIVSAGGGDDLVEVRDGGRDDVDCGSGRDLAVADERDRLRNCERVRR